MVDNILILISAPGLGAEKTVKSPHRRIGFSLYMHCGKRDVDYTVSGGRITYSKQPIPSITTHEINVI